MTTKQSLYVASLVLELFGVALLGVQEAVWWGNDAGRVARALAACFQAFTAALNPIRNRWRR